MKIIKKLLITMLLTIIITNIFCKSKAVIEEGKTKVIGTWIGTMEYAYKGEDRTMVTRSCEERPAYSMKKTNERTEFIVSELTPYNNKEIKNILKNGYGCKTYEELKCMNQVEAFFATQEAICIALEDRNIEDYVTESEQARRILDATKNILKNASNEQEEEIQIEEINSEWVNYAKDNNYKYKEYMVNSLNETNGNIIVEQGNNIKIIDEYGNIKNEFKANDKFYLLVPKGIEQEVTVKLSYEKDSIAVFTSKKENDDNNKFIISQPGIDTIQKELNINVKGNSKIEITNKDKETNEAISGNVFSIQKENGEVVMDNLITNDNGKISVTLKPGNYYLKQNSAVEGYTINKALINIKAQDNQTININVMSTKGSTEETVYTDYKVNVTEESKDIIEKNITEETNVETTNINKEIINQTNQTNLHNVNNFINTTNRKNILNLEKENFYRNQIQEEVTNSKTLEGENNELTMTRQDYINYMDMVMANSAKLPILPVASR